MPQPSNQTIRNALSELENIHRRSPLGPDLIRTAQWLRELTKPIIEHDYPSPPSSDDDTSLAAAESVRATLNSMQAEVLRFIKGRGEYGATCEEVEIGLGMKHQTASARVRELRAKGRIEKSGRKRLTTSNRNAVVYLPHPEFDNAGL